jgi:hypothetical protein
MVAAGVAGGLTAAQVTGNGTGAVVLQGPIAAINATLAAGVRYLGNFNFNGTDTLTIVADDLGNAGAGGAMAASASVSIRVASPTEQIDGLQAAVAALSAQGMLNHGQANSLAKKLEHAQAALDKGKIKVAYELIGAFIGKVRSLVGTGVLTAAEGDSLLSATDLLLKSLQIGGGF